MPSTFHCALHLGVTVDFPALSPPASPSGLGSSTPKESADGTPLPVKTSLFPTATVSAKTPSTNDAEKFFSAYQPSATSYFPKANNPRGLVRSDSHVPEWAPSGSLLFRQPKSRADELPPHTILRFTQQQMREKELASAANARHHSRTTSRSDSDAHWGQEWNIVPAVQGNGGLTNAVRAAINSGSADEVLWVGTIGFPTDSVPRHTKDEIHEHLETEYDSLPVFVKDSDFDGHYNHFCRSILWPVFHYQIPDNPKSKAYEDHSWKYYVNVNQAFADKIITCYKRGDKIWVHDYHLLLVPGMVRKALSEAQIGIFLHTAFPSSEVFRCLSVRQQLLEGMLGANLVAFQNTEYEEHFLATCSRLLLVEATRHGLQMENRFVNVSSVPIGIDPKALNEERKEVEVAEWIKTMQERYKGKRLIVARDKLDLVRGVRQKLLAYELFLNSYPEWCGKVVLIQVAISTSENAELNAAVSEIVTRIESQHATLAHQPLVFLRQDIAFSQYLALLSVADALMITSLREGMNLTPHEFIACQDGRESGKKHGPVILSEFTGCISVFDNHVLSINPWDYRKCAVAIKTALEMDAAEKEQRYQSMRDIVLNHTGEAWVLKLGKQLSKFYAEQYSHDAMSIPRLSTVQLSEKYRKSQRRVFILDYEGTLASLASLNENVHLSSPQRVLDTLSDLLLDDKNTVYIMSGQTPETLQRLFARVPRLGIIAENGCFAREAGQEEWISFVDTDRMEAWKSEVKTVLRYYQERIHGSSIEENHCSLRLKYDRAEDPKAAGVIAGDCANNINDACNSMRIRALPSERSVLVEPIDWSKNSAAAHIFEELKAADASNRSGVAVDGEASTGSEGEQQGLAPDFLMVAGNDREDEGIFRWANALQKNGEIHYVTTVSVGKRNTEAMCTLTQGTTGLLSVLNKLSKI